MGQRDRASEGQLRRGVHIRSRRPKRQETAEPLPQWKAAALRFLHQTDELVRLFYRPNPRDQFAAMKAAMESMPHIAAALPLSEDDRRRLGLLSLMLSSLSGMLADAAKGNYTDPRWPERKTGRKSNAQRDAERSLVTLALWRQRLDGGSLLKACRRAVGDLEYLFQDAHGIRVTDLVREYGMDASGDPQPARRTRRHKAPTSALDRLAERVARWARQKEPEVSENLGVLAFMADEDGPEETYDTYLRTTASHFLRTIKSEIAPPLEDELG